MISYEVPPNTQHEINAVGGSTGPSRVSPINDSNLNSQCFGSVPTTEPTTIGRFEDELDVQTGWSIRVIQLYDEWAMCWNPIDGYSGLVPLSYLQIFLDEDDTDAAALASNTELTSKDGTLFNNETKSELPSVYQTPPNLFESQLFAEVQKPFDHPTSAYKLPPLYQIPPESQPETPVTESKNWYDETKILQPVYPALQSLSQSTPWPTQTDMTETIARDSGNNSLSSSNTNEGDNLTTQKENENLGEFMELFGMKPLSQQERPDTVSMKSVTPPPRPPLPQRPVQLIQPMSVVPSRSASKTDAKYLNSPVWQQKFVKIVEELLSSEIQYSTELHVWEQCISQSTRLSEQQKAVLTNGYPMLRDLSQHLVRSISEQCDKSPEQQAYGQMFMRMRDKFNRTFAYYFRCVEEITQVIENKGDHSTHDALHQCLQQMRDAGVFVFDVTTAVVRPIQRCLKYPLFIAELLKLLPLTHIDHPKLLEANKQMQTLVTKMNESKRRKELMKKYRNDQQDNSFASKLAKLNLHTIQKKSNRLRYRIVTSIGLGSKPDAEFCNMISELETAERRLCKLLYNIQLYKVRIMFMTKKYINFTTVDTRKLRSQAEEPIRWDFNAYLKMLDVFLQNYQKQIQNTVVVPCQHVRKTGYTKWIEKRNDKLADYETARARKCSIDELEKLRCEFEALNAHVKTNLPKIYTVMNEQVTKMAQTMVMLDEMFFKRITTYLSEIPAKLQIFVLPNFVKFVDPTNQRLFNLKKHLQAVTVVQQQQMKLASKA